MQKEKKYKLLLINPINPTDRGFVVNLPSRYPPLGLGYVAALTPEHWDVYILDEAFKAFEYRDADLVGFTAFTFTAPRAYELAAFYREKGIPTVLGGIHASMLPEEAKEYMDAVVVGEAESVWPQLIADFEIGQMKREYRGGLADLKNLPIPRHDLFHPDYWFASVFTTRGCPSNCAFCSVTSFNGSKHRFRPVDEVLDEIATIEKRLIFFVDDNITGYGREAKEHALAIFKGMKERNFDKIWFSQASLNFADDEELLKAASDSGCRMILIGIESEKEEQLLSANKHFNVKRLDKYAETFRRMHKYQISVLGTFMFGMDGDTPQALHDRKKYILRSGVDTFQTTIMTPLPGTRMFREFEQNNRLLKTNFPQDWNYYQFLRVVFKPSAMEASELFDTMIDVWRALYSRRMIEWKAVKTFWSMRSWNLHRWFTRGWQATLWAFHTNWIYRNLIVGKSKKNRVKTTIRTAE
ncbi:MAG: B12-binding domain-containing radical SAM protein [Bacteroidales bacterium]|nr:B12-binding domain-containing radical SAM protein [Bacteroidales bacterium]